MPEHELRCLLRSSNKRRSPKIHRLRSCVERLREWRASCSCRASARAPGRISGPSTKLRKRTEASSLSTVTSRAASANSGISFVHVGCRSAARAHRSRARGAANMNAPPDGFTLVGYSARRVDRRDRARKWRPFSAPRPDRAAGRSVDREARECAGRGVDVVLVRRAGPHEIRREKAGRARSPCNLHGNAKCTHGNIADGQRISTTPSHGSTRERPASPASDRESRPRAQHDQPPRPCSFAIAMLRLLASSLQVARQTRGVFVQYRRSLDHLEAEHVANGAAEHAVGHGEFFAEMNCFPRNGAIHRGRSSPRAFPIRLVEA